MTWAKEAGAMTALAVPLETQDLTLSLGGRVVVDKFTAELRAGEWTAIVGPNGAGKSSLLQLLAGLRLPDRGQVLLHGRPLGQWPLRERAQHIAWLAQQSEAEGDIAARDVVRLGRLPHQGLLGSVTAADDAAVRQAMQETECVAFAQRRLNELSGGERQRVLLARALAVGAQILLLDEPTTHVDAPHQRALLRSLAARARDGAAVAAVLHDLGLALAAPRVWVMDKGRLVAVFEDAFSIVSVSTGHGARWVAVPSL
jgi:iron complex transport system ATP-binding protein